MHSRRSQGNRSEISRRANNRLHPAFMLVLSCISEEEEELCAAAAITGSRAKVAVYIGRARQGPGADGRDADLQ